MKLMVANSLDFDRKEEIFLNKNLSAFLINDKNINTSINIIITAPSLRSTEIIGNFEHLFLHTSDNKFLNV